MTARNVGVVVLAALALASMAFGVEDTESAARWFALVVFLTLCTGVLLAAIRTHDVRVDAKMRKRLPSTCPHCGASTRRASEDRANDDRVAHLHG